MIAREEYRIAFPVADTSVPIAHAELEVMAILFERLEAEGLVAAAPIDVDSMSIPFQIVVRTLVRQRVRGAGGGRETEAVCPRCGAGVSVVDPLKEL